MKGFDKYYYSFLIGMKSSMEYRANFFLSILSALFPIFIQTFLWISVYKNSSSPVIFGYSFAQIIQYTVFAQLVSRFIRTDFEYEINDDIKNGGLNKFIIRPIGYFTYRLCCFLGQKIMNLIMIIVLFIFAFFLFRYFLGSIITIENILGFIIALILSLCLNFLIFFCISTLGFWFTEIGFLFEALRIVIIALSGGIFPLKIFGPAVASILDWMPFKYTINFPVDILNSQDPGWALIKGYFTQIAWIITLLLLAKLCWRIGSKKYVAVGA